jgi:hypothetical protein
METISCRGRSKTLPVLAAYTPKHFKDITADSFTRVLQEREPGQPLQDTATILALRKSEPGMITERSTGDPLRMLKPS